ncbi:hypothetical protein AZA_85651 [Nitrospirillum viridazoti Y2]|nr:hypothetical protein AZA_85651 [Nitrospirillum amazonense Y2]
MLHIQGKEGQDQAEARDGGEGPEQADVQVPSPMQGFHDGHPQKQQFALKTGAGEARGPIYGTGKGDRF